MPIKRPPLINKEIYHIVIRAIENLELFRDINDYLRMIHDLFEFNDEDPVPSSYRMSQKRRLNVQGPNVTRTVLVTLTERKTRKLLVEILAFCLMPNHVHLLVRQVRDGGISKFMRKIGAGYGIYYNNKYKRSGHVFQGKYRIVHIENEEQLKTVFVYIHTNPVALIVPHWKEKGLRVNDLEKIIKFLENYRWSSYSDFLQNKNFPSLTSREFLTRIMKGVDGSREFVNGWLQFKKEFADFKQVAIE